MPHVHHDSSKLESLMDGGCTWVEGQLLGRLG